MTTSDQSESAAFLEPATQQFVDLVCGDPPLFLLPPAEARAVFAGLQSQPVGKPSVQSDNTVLPTGPTGSVPIRIVRPRDAGGALPAVFYCHGGGWICGDADTHDRLIREIAVGAGVAVVFIDYDLAPEAQHPVAIEQAYAAILHVAEHAQE